MTTFREAGWKALAAVAAVLFLTLLFSLARFERVGVPAIAAALLLVILSARRPSTALIVLASVIPVATWLGRRWDPSVAWVETLAIAFSAGYCARQCTTARDDADELDLPLLLTTAVVVASLFVQFAVEVWRFGGTAVGEFVWQLVSQNYLRTFDSWDPLDAAMRAIESLVIVRAASAAARRDGTFAPLLVKSLVFGAAAASAVNVLRLWEGALRLDAPLRAFAGFLLSQRFNAHYGDVNAAGSFFVMALFAALGLTRLRQGWRWGLAAVVIAASVWITGSRMALLAGLVALAAPAAVVMHRALSPRARRFAFAAAAVCTGCGGGRHHEIAAGEGKPARSRHRFPGPLGTRPHEPAYARRLACVRRWHRPVSVPIRRVQLARAPRGLSAGRPRERAQQLPADPRGARSRRARGLRLDPRRRGTIVRVSGTHESG